MTDFDVPIGNRHIGHEGKGTVVSSRKTSESGVESVHGSESGPGHESSHSDRSAHLSENENDSHSEARKSADRVATAPVNGEHGVHDATGENESKTDEKTAEEANSIWNVENVSNWPIPADNDPDCFDPACDYNNPVRVSFAEVTAAAFKIRDGIVRTPCTRSRMSERLGMEVYFKKDFMQYTGSFKERGARYALLMIPPELSKKGVVAASAGNHALALAFHGRELGIPVTVFMPTHAPLMKIQFCKSFEANVIIKGENMSETKKVALKFSKRAGMSYINGYDHRHILAGQGTCALEIVEQVKGIDAVIVPVGGGGLIAGMSVAIKNLNPSIKVIGCQSRNAPGFFNAMQARRPVVTKTTSSLADGLSVPLIGTNSFATSQPYVDQVVVVNEEEIAVAILRLIELEKSIVEGAGACGLAAVLGGYVPELHGKKVVIVLSGGNIDTTALGRVLERGLAVDGRMQHFVVMVPDKPGGIADLCRLIADCGVSIKDIFHERTFVKSDIFSAEVKCIVETRDAEHARNLNEVLLNHYKYVKMGRGNFE